MKRILALAVACAAVAALADEVLKLRTSGTGTQWAYYGASQKIAFQCPGYQVFYRPCAGSGGATDAGAGGCAATTAANGVMVDFIANPDPYKTQLRPGVDRIGVINTDAGLSVCNHFSEYSP